MNFDELIECGMKAIDSKRINRYIKVGDCVCVIESKNNKIYVGQSYSFSNFGYCAEQSAIISMFNDGEYEISKIVTVSKTGDIISPCGRCLELISQTVNSENIEIALSKYVSKKVIEIYPYDWKRIENYNIGMPLDSNDPYNLKRFIAAQEDFFDRALKEIKNGKKETHWIWYIFPTHMRLAKNIKSEYYGLSSIQEAKAYYSNEYLRNNMIVICRQLLKLNTNDLCSVVGKTDSRKIHSCLSLFYRSSGDDIFLDLINKYFNGLFESETMTFLDEENEHE